MCPLTATRYCAAQPTPGRQRVTALKRQPKAVFQPSIHDPLTATKYSRSRCSRPPEAVQHWSAQNCIPVIQLKVHSPPPSTADHAAPGRPNLLAPPPARCRAAHPPSRVSAPAPRTAWRSRGGGWGYLAVLEGRRACRRNRRSTSSVKANNWPAILQGGTTPPLGTTSLRQHPAICPLQLAQRRQAIERPT